MELQALVVLQGREARHRLEVPMEGRRRHVGSVGHLLDRHARRDVRLDPVDRLSDAVALRILREGGGQGRALRTEERAEVDFAKQHRRHHFDFVRTV